jgi:DGQHR domain-containing protein
MSVSQDLLREKKLETLEKAQIQAGMEVANTGGFAVPVIIFRQGSRRSLTGALPMSWVKSRLETRSARKQGSILNARAAMNRPEIEQHSEGIAKYLVENYRRNYIIPPLTLNIQQPVDLYTVDYPNAFVPGWIVIPATAKLAITDGQHRRSGIIKALDELSPEDQSVLGGDSIAVMITCESEIAQVHQDFADCSKTKALPSSMLAVYDLRNPANRLVLDLEKRCKLFTGRIDPTSKTLSKRSTLLFLANQLRQLVKELLLGSYALPDADFERHAQERLSTDQKYNEAITRYSEYINELTAQIPVWAEIASLPDSLEASKIPARRAQGWICLTATGLNLIGRVGHYVFQQQKDNWKTYAHSLAEVDWSRQAEIWQGAIVQSGRLLNQQASLKAAFRRICEKIDLKLS